MSKKAITKLWSFFGLTFLSLSFLFFLRTTGMDPKGDSFGILGYTAATIPALALPMDYFLCTIFLWLSLVWSRQVGGPTWAHRQPIFYFETGDVDVGTSGGRVFQLWAFVLTMGVPLLLVTQMVARFFGGSVYANCQCTTSGLAATCQPLCGPTKSTARVAEGMQQFDFARLSAVDPMLRFGDVNGPQFFPVLPWIYAAWGLALLALWLFATWSIFRREPSLPGPSGRIHDVAGKVL